MGKRTKQSQELVKAIEQSGMSRYAIAKATGIEQSTLMRVVKGTGWLSRDNFDKLTKLLKLELRKVG